MSSPHSMDLNSNFVRCIKCGKIIKGSHYNVTALLDHLRNDHPEIDIIDTDTKHKRRFHAAPSTTATNSFTRPPETIQDCHASDADCASSAQLKEPLQVKPLNLSPHSATSEILAKYPEIKACEYAPHNPNAQVAYTRRYRLGTPSPMAVRLLQQPFQYTLYRTSLEKWCPANGSIYCPKCGSHRRPLIKTKAERFTRNGCGACCLLSCWPFCFVPWILPGQNPAYLYCESCKTFLGLYDRQRNCLKPNRLYISSGRQQRPQPATTNSNLLERAGLLENESPPPQSRATDSSKSTHISSIIVNGRELPADVVARIQKYKSFGAFVGVDFNALQDAATKVNDNETAAPSAAPEKAA